jgi:putative resolvase
VRHGPPPWPAIPEAAAKGAADWAKREGVSYLTARRWWKEGRLPVPAHQTPSGSILVDLPAEMAAGRTVVYARVSPHDQRSDMERQVARVTEWAMANGMAVNEVVTEVGAGLNGRRRRFQRHREV